MSQNDICPVCLRPNCVTDHRECSPPGGKPPEKYLVEPAPGFRIAQGTPFDQLVTR